METPAESVIPILTFSISTHRQIARPKKVEPVIPNLTLRRGTKERGAVKDVAFAYVDEVIKETKEH